MSIGHIEGSALAVDEAPWPLDWEQDPRIDDGHAHEWERVVVSWTVGRTEPVIRCTSCHVPRCGHSDDPDPCMERRHHDSVHITLGGSFEPVGGYLR